MSHWLDNAVFYEVYPQSFQDSNSDGIGDIQGVIHRLDYIKELGCNALWINPVFDSPFYDAGYDVTDYYLIAPRYGTNEDMVTLFEEAHKRDMHVLMDLVPGHTSLQNEWFTKSALDETNEYTDTFIWKKQPRDGKVYPNIAHFVQGLSERPGGFAVNCFSSQPALNYGFGKVTEDWQFSAESPQAEHTRLLMQSVCDFWLSLGCDGFRVDMAGSLVKDDEDSKYTIKLWQKTRAFLEAKYPDMVLLSEWGDPKTALKAGFHMDFLLHFGPSHYMDLFRDKPFFAGDPEGTFTAFAQTYGDIQASLEGTDGLVAIPSGNHDMIRMRDTLSEEEMRLAFAFLMTMPGVPFIYYGDEIALPYLHGLRSKEGGYERTGSRTPMQWDNGANAGFSHGAPKNLYLPLATAEESTNAKAQMADPNSLWHEIHKLIALRQSHPVLQSHGQVSFLTVPEGVGALMYQRQNEEETVRVLINPTDKERKVKLDLEKLTDKITVLHTLASYHCEGTITGDTVVLPPKSYLILSI